MKKYSCLIFLLFILSCVKHKESPFGPSIDNAGSINYGNKIIIEELLLDDFQDGDFNSLYSQAGAWKESRDDFSYIQHSLKTEVISGITNYYLRVDYEVEGYAPYPSIDEELSFSPDQVFYSKYNAVYFKMRGNGKTVRVYLKNNQSIINVDYDFYYATVTPSQQWSEYLIPFDDFTVAGYFQGYKDGSVTIKDCLNNVEKLSFSSKTVGDIGWFEIDDVKIVKFVYKR